ncbi:MAG: hypothetical protein ACPGQL_11010 [Thermoplasmatota archaeon]
MARSLPRTWWVLVGFSIALFAVSAGLVALQQAYTDLYDLGLCDNHRTEQRANSSLQTCKDTRMMAAAADVGATLARVPAIGLLLLAFGVLALHWRRGPEATMDAAEAQGKPAAMPMVEASSETKPTAA